MIITREKGMRMWGGGSGSTSASGVNGGGGFSLTVTEGEGAGNAYTGFTYESGVLSLIKGTQFVTTDFFNRLFTAYDANGTAIVPNDTTTAINNLKLMVGTWTEEYLSALGKNSEGGGGGGGIELSDVWQSLKTNTDDYANQKINSAHIPDLSGTYATKTWVNQQGFVTSSGVTSVAMTVPTGLSVSGTPITSTGTLALAFSTGYSIPTTAKQSDWDTAYGWGNHATAGYASASSVTTLQGYFTNGVANTAAKLNTGTTTYTAWGQTYWSSGVPQSISGNMTSVGSITPSANGNALGTTSARFNIFGYAGNFSDNVSIGGALSVTSGITLTTTKKIYFGDTSHYLELDSTGFHFSHGVYSDSFVSALGSNSSGGGSGTFDEEAMWTALGTTITAKVIASSHIPNLDASKITSGTFAAARIPDLSGNYYALYGGTDLNPTSSNTINLNDVRSTGSYYVSINTQSQYVTNKPDDTQNYAFRVWVSAPGGISGYRRQRFQYLTQMTIYERFYSTDTSSWGNWYKVQDIFANYALASSLNNYLPLSGGTLTGNLTISTGADRKLVINNTDTETKYSLISFQQNGTEYGTLGTRGNDNLTWNGYGIINTNNIGSYALPLSGGTLTGSLYVATGYGISDATGNGLLVYKPSPVWGGISSTQWGVGAGDCEGVIRSSNTSLLHYNAGTQQHYVILDTSNFNLYSPTNTGTGASGTWGISISGNAATATKATQDGSGNTITSTYLPLSGGTLTGQLYIKTGTAGSIRLVSANSINYIQSGNAAFDGNADMIIGGYSATTGTNLNLDFSVVKATSILKVKTYLTLGYGAEGIYLNGTGIYWHNASDSWTKNIMSFTSTGATTINGVTTISNATQVSGVDDILSAGSDVAGTSAANKGFAIRLGMYNGNYSTKIACVYEQSNPQYLNPAIVFYTMYNTYAKGSEVERMRLSSAGNLTVSGEVTASSDERKKNIISKTKFNVKDIASARSILFEWKDRKDKIHGGSIAQDWLGKADSFLLQDDDGFYSINYGALALCSAITIAREVVKHEDEITRLKKEVVKLRERVAELEERRA